MTTKGFFLHMHRPPLAYEVFDRPFLPSAQAIFVLCVGHFSSRKGPFLSKKATFCWKNDFLLKIRTGQAKIQWIFAIFGPSGHNFSCGTTFLSLQANFLRTGQYAGMPGICKKTTLGPGAQPLVGPKDSEQAGVEPPGVEPPGKFWKTLGPLE